MNWLMDVEANGLDPDTIHVISVKEYPNGKTMSFTNMDFFREWIYYLRKKKKIKKIFFHNGLGYDVDVINKLVEPNLIRPYEVVDTLVVSKTLNYPKFRTHSLKELGEHLGVYKGDYEGGWDHYSEEMREYCEQDVEVLKAIVDMYWSELTDPRWKDALRTEHEMAIVCKEMERNGFEFDVEKAEVTLAEVVKEKTKLEDGFDTAFGSTLVPVKTLKLRRKDDGSLYSNILKAQSEYPKVDLDESAKEVIVYDYKKFNPGSPRDRIDLLWDAGWEPVEKTKGHLNAIRKSRPF